MENVFKYYEFTDFIEDKSSSFKGESFCYTVLNEQHFLIFEKQENQFNLYVSKYSSEKAIGIEAPEILELVVSNYDKSLPEHRIALRAYLD